VSDDPIIFGVTVVVVIAMILVGGILLAGWADRIREREEQRQPYAQDDEWEDSNE
jgi:hypothetical protein